jgi:uncharacterized membrane protein (UPF0127 family)
MFAAMIRTPIPRLLLLAFILLVPLAASTQESGQALEKSQLVIRSDERDFAFRVELAKSSEERRVGLMHRKDLAPNAGMLFDFGRTAPVSMWMRNTYIPLDMLFISEDGEIINIAHDAVPHSEAILASDGPVRAVLEIPAGTTRLLGIKAGDRVLHPTLGNRE